MTPAAEPTSPPSGIHSGEAEVDEVAKRGRKNQ
jgi:hypothetical protein